MQKLILRKLPRFLKRFWIPKNTPYCYDYRPTPEGELGNLRHPIKVCPFWENTLVPFPEDALVPDYAEVAYCYYLGKSDTDLRWQVTDATIRKEDGEYELIHPKDWYDYGLMWDQCKECGVRGYD